MTYQNVITKLGSAYILVYHVSKNIEDDIYKYISFNDYLSNIAIE